MLIEQVKCIFFVISRRSTELATNFCECLMIVCFSLIFLAVFGRQCFNDIGVICYVMSYSVLCDGYRAQRAAKEAKEAPAQPAPEKPRVDIKRFVKIGRPGYKVTKQRDPDSGQQSLLFQVPVIHVYDLLFWWICTIAVIVVLLFYWVRFCSVRPQKMLRMSPKSLNVQQWATLVTLAAALQPSLGVSKEMSAVAYLTMSVVICIMDMLCHLLLFLHMELMLARNSPPHWVPTDFTQLLSVALQIIIINNNNNNTSISIPPPSEVLSGPTSPSSQISNTSPVDSMFTVPGNW